MNLIWRKDGSGLFEAYDCMRGMIINMLRFSPRARPTAEQILKENGKVWDLFLKNPECVDIQGHKAKLAYVELLDNLGNEFNRLQKDGVIPTCKELGLTDIRYYPVQYWNLTRVNENSLMLDYGIPQHKHPTSDNFGAGMVENLLTYFHTTVSPFGSIKINYITAKFMENMKTATNKIFNRVMIILKEECLKFQVLDNDSLEALKNYAVLKINSLINDSCYEFIGFVMQAEAQIKDISLNPNRIRVVFAIYKFIFYIIVKENQDDGLG